MPKIDKKPRDSNYFYSFDKTTAKSIPTGDELRDFVFAVSKLLGKKGLNEDDFEIQEARTVMTILSKRDGLLLLKTRMVI